MRTYVIFWSPNGKRLWEVKALSYSHAIKRFRRMAKDLGMAQYVRYPGEVYALVKGQTASEYLDEKQQHMA